MMTADTALGSSDTRIVALDFYEVITLHKQIRGIYSSYRLGKNNREISRLLKYINKDRRNGHSGLTTPKHVRRAPWLGVPCPGAPAPACKPAQPCDRRRGMQHIYIATSLSSLGSSKRVTFSRFSKVNVVPSTGLHFSINRRHIVEIN